MKWTIRWTSWTGEEFEEKYYDLANAITRAEGFTEEDVERVRLFFSQKDDDGDTHVATFYTPKKGGWA